LIRSILGALVRLVTFSASRSGPTLGTRWRFCRMRQFCQQGKDSESLFFPRGRTDHRKDCRPHRLRQVSQHFGNDGQAVRTLMARISAVFGLTRHQFRHHSGRRLRIPLRSKGLMALLHQLAMLGVVARQGAWRVKFEFQSPTATPSPAPRLCAPTLATACLSLPTPKTCDSPRRTCSPPFCAMTCHPRLWWTTVGARSG